MATIRSFTSLEQSRRLGKFLPNESADMYYREWKRDTNNIRIANVGTADESDLPCWSLAALLNTLPSATLDSSNDHHYRLHCMGRFTEWYDNPIDACVAMIEKLHELKML